MSSAVDDVSPIQWLVEAHLAIGVHPSSSAATAANRSVVREEAAHQSRTMSDDSAGGRRPPPVRPYSASSTRSKPEMLSGEAQPIPPRSVYGSGFTSRFSVHSHSILGVAPTPPPQAPQPPYLSKRPTSAPSWRVSAGPTIQASAAGESHTAPSIRPMSARPLRTAGAGGLGIGSQSGFVSSSRSSSSRNGEGAADGSSSGWTPAYSLFTSKFSLVEASHLHAQKPTKKRPMSANPRVESGRHSEVLAGPVAVALPTDSTVGLTSSAPEASATVVPPLRPLGPPVESSSIQIEPAEASLPSTTMTIPVGRSQRPVVSPGECFVSPFPAPQEGKHDHHKPIVSLLDADACLGPILPGPSGPRSGLSPADHESSTVVASPKLSRSNSTSHTFPFHSLRNMRHVGAAAVAASKLLKIMPGTTIEELAERIDVSRLDVFLDRLTRFFCICKGKIFLSNLRRERARAEESASWERLLEGSMSPSIVDSSYVVAARSSTSVSSLADVSSVDVTDLGLVLRSADGGDPSYMWFSEVSQLRRAGDLEVEVLISDGSGDPNRTSEQLCLVFTNSAEANKFTTAVTSRLTHCLKLSNEALLKLSSRSLCIVHFNDVYHLNPFKNPNGPGVVGGASRFLTKLKEIQSYRNPLVLFSGDFMGPSLMSVLMKGKQMVDAFNLIGVHFGTFGNHEFDYGMEPLIDCVHGQVQGNFVFAGSNTKWIMSNMSDASGKPLGHTSRYETLVWNGIRIGILGLSENWLLSCNQLKQTEAFYADCFEEGERLARRLKTAEGCELVIALTHSRYQTDKEMSSRCPSIDLILGGHDHFYKNSPKRRIVKSGEEFEFLTEIEISVPAERHHQLAASKGLGKFLKRTIKTHPIVLSITPDAHMEALIARYEKRLQARMGKVIGTTSIPLDCTEACCRFKEGSLPNFFVDVMAERAGADFAILGGAAIAGKAVMAPGDITLGDVFNWFPNDTRVMTVRLLGSTVKKMLNVMVKDVPDEAPSFPHPSVSLHFKINTLRTPTTVQDITVRGEPLDPEAWYVVAVEDFVGLGKAKYKFIPIEGQMVCDDEAAEQITFWIIEYFEGRKKQQEGPADNNQVDDADAEQSMIPKQRQSSRSILRPRSKSDASLSSSAQPVSSLPTTSWVDVTRVLDGRALAMVMEETSRFGNITNLSLAALCEYVCYALQRLVRCDLVRLIYFDDTARMAWCVLPVCTFVPAKRVSTDRFRGSYVVAREEGKTVFITDLFDDKRYDRRSERHPRGTPIRNIMSVPVGTYEDRYATCVCQCFNKLPAHADKDGFTDLAPQFTEIDSVVASLFLSQAAPLIQLAAAREDREAVEQQQHLLLNAATEILGNKDLSVIKLNEQIVVINNHANIVFGCKAASFYVVDAVVDEVWTVNTGVKKSDLVIERHSTQFNQILAKAIETKEIVNSAMTSGGGGDSNESSAGGGVGDRNRQRKVAPEMAIPVFVPQSDELLGVLLLKNRKTDAHYSLQDMTIAEHFCSFAAVAVQTSNEVEVLRTGVNRSTLRPFPIVPLGRIQFLRGWGSVQKLIKVIISPEFAAKLHAAAMQSSEDNPPMEESQFE